LFSLNEHLVNGSRQFGKLNLPRSLSSRNVVTTGSIVERWHCRLH